MAETGGNSRWEGNHKNNLIAAYSLLGRQKLGDIAATKGFGRAVRSDANDLRGALCANPQDYVDHLLKAISERNKTIELMNAELQNLRLVLKGSCEQNRDLARANAMMLKQNNSFKDREKVLSHELACTKALLNSLTLELKEERKNKQLSEKVCAKECATCDEAAEEAPSLAYDENASEPKEQVSQSIGSTSFPREVGGNHKGCKRRKSSQKAAAAVLSSKRSDSIEDTFSREDDSFQACSLIAESTHEDGLDQLGSSAPNSSITSPGHGRDDYGGNECITFQCHNEESQRTSIGRPTRKAARKCSSYKEMPLNAKMRKIDSEVSLDQLDASTPSGSDTHEEHGKNDDQKNQDLPCDNQESQRTSAERPPHKVTRKGNSCKKAPLSIKMERIEHEDNRSQLDSSTSSSSDLFLKQEIDDDQRKQSIVVKSSNQDSEGTSIRKPTRRGARKGISCKKMPLNVKMRRIEHEGSSHGQLDSSNPCSSDSCVKPELDDNQKKQSISEECHNQESDRTSIRRPTRRAATKVCSYKEVPINVKMRRVEQQSGVQCWTNISDIVK